MPVLTHGTLGGYTNHACRCQPCRDAVSAYYRIYRTRLREAGQCQDCSRPSAPFKRCERHRAYQATRTRAYKLRKKESVHVTA